ncbi:MAG: CoA activase [Spirochaetota bacterium]|nr:MAG: CoA activase [Spirochaetota bacterium]
MESESRTSFQSLNKGIGVYNAKDKTLLMPQLYRFATHLMAAGFRGFGIKAQALETYKGLDFGKAHTSGKECLPCLITTGDILYYMQNEKRRLGENFNPDNYIYLMPESDGPCRFGMYNKYQRMVLDSFPELRRVRIGFITSINDYSFEGMIDGNKATDIRKTGYLSIVIGDVLDRLTCRIRPYEKERGLTDAFVEEAMHEMEDIFETYGDTTVLYDKVLDKLHGIIREAVQIIDHTIPRKPLVGIVGEIYLRAHDQANHDIIRVLEHHGAEVVNTSFAEWINYISYHRMREAKRGFVLSMKQLRLRKMIHYIKKVIAFKSNLVYEQYIQKRIYKSFRSFIDVAEDHHVSHLEDLLKQEDAFDFDIGTEACLSISGILSYARDRFNGVINVYPFTCMPGSVTTSIVRPLTSRLRIPYLDAPCDVSIQPGREAAIRTFMYQVYQHFKERERLTNNHIQGEKIVCA